MKKYLIVFLPLFLAGCAKDRIVVQTEVFLISPKPVECPEEPKIEIDPRNDKFTERLIVEYISILRESHNICRKSKELQDEEMKELRKKYEDK